jgi:uncharacterized damage-inducible protein DinB
MELLINQLWSYNDWASQKLISTLEEYTPEVPAASMHLLSHIMNTQYIWLARIKGITPALGVWDDHSLEICKSLHAESSFNLKKEIENHDLQQVIEYTNTKGISFQNSLHDILLHVFNHGTYHRAQIAMDLRINGLQPVLTDYIAFVRE